MTSAHKRHDEAAGESLADLVAIHVWDWPVRLFHWSIVTLLVIAVVSSYIGGDAKEWHMRAGYGVLAMVLFRILWGFAGTRHARFSSFMHGPRTVIRYARSFARRAPQAAVGHNPLGGWSVIALLLALLVQAGTGLFANDDVLMEGPLVKFISKDVSDRLTSLHHLNIWVLGILIGTHVSAVVGHLAITKENLVRAMVTGRKHLDRALASEGVEKVPHGRAIVFLAASILSVWWLVTRL
jgi:cytochrome b